MLTIMIGMVVFVLFTGIMGIAFTLKRNKKSNVSCGGGCSACKN
jgi:hypothetical protein